VREILLGALVILCAVATAFVAASTLRPGCFSSWLLVAYLALVTDAVGLCLALSPSH
jgi:hypothetical protein